MPREEDTLSFRVDLGTPDRDTDLLPDFTHLTVDNRLNRATHQLFASFSVLFCRLLHGDVSVDLLLCFLPLRGIGHCASPRAPTVSPYISDHARIGRRKLAWSKIDGGGRKLMEVAELCRSNIRTGRKLVIYAKFNL